MKLSIRADFKDFDQFNFLNKQETPPPGFNQTPGKFSDKPYAFFESFEDPEEFLPFIHKQTDIVYYIYLEKIPNLLSFIKKEMDNFDKEQKNIIKEDILSVLPLMASKPYYQYTSTPQISNQVSEIVEKIINFVAKQLGFDNPIQNGFIQKYVTYDNKKMKFGKFLQNVKRNYLKLVEPVKQKFNQNLAQVIGELLHYHELNPTQKEWTLIVSAEPCDMMTATQDRSWRSCMVLGREGLDLYNQIKDNNLIAYAVIDNMWIARTILKNNGKMKFWPEETPYFIPSKINYQNFLSAVKVWLKQRNLLDTSNSLPPEAKAWTDKNCDFAKNFVHTPEQINENQFDYIEDSRKNIIPESKIFYPFIFKTNFFEISKEDIKKLTNNNFKNLFMASYSYIEMPMKYKNIFKNLKSIIYIKSIPKKLTFVTVPFDEVKDENLIENLRKGKTPFLIDYGKNTMTIPKSFQKTAKAMSFTWLKNNNILYTSNYPWIEFAKKYPQIFNIKKNTKNIYQFTHPNWARILIANSYIEIFANNKTSIEVIKELIKNNNIKFATIRIISPINKTTNLNYFLKANSWNDIKTAP